MRISDWSSDVCSSDLLRHEAVAPFIGATDRATAIPAELESRDVAADRVDDRIDIGRVAGRPDGKVEIPGYERETRIQTRTAVNVEGGQTDITRPVPRPPHAPAQSLLGTDATEDALT